MADVMSHFNYLHRIPELGMHEFKTSAYVADVLTRAGYAVRRHVGSETGLTAELSAAAPGPVLGLRSDMDALGTADAPAHLCGHDGHMAMLLAAAEEIAAEGLVKHGTLRLLFQPSEEIGDGALSMVKGGACEGLDYLIGMHIRPAQECRVGEAAPALFYSAATHLCFHIHGQQSHGARPYLGVSALEAACLIVAAAHSLHFDSNVVHNMKATQLHADAGASNAVPGEATLVFDLRSQDNAVMDAMTAALRRAAREAAATIGATVTEEILAETPASIITPEVTGLIAGVIREELGDAALIPPITTAGAEDFFWYPKKCPELKTGFIGLGTGALPGLHDPAMHFDTSALASGVKLHKGLVKKILG